MFRWIEDLKPTPGETTATFLPVAVPAPAEPKPVVAANFGEPRRAASTGADDIEIELSNGRRMRVSGSVDGDAFKRVCALLQE